MNNNILGIDDTLIERVVYGTSCRQEVLDYMLAKGINLSQAYDEVINKKSGLSASRRQFVVYQYNRMKAATAKRESSQDAARVVAPGTARAVPAGTEEVTREG